ncbi:MAG: HAMP domain-containing histidine kinase [Deltaproteobacteria bacterium]|nr:HAMP domain-containing histidine kinase [Deltaproteobacteria bacterium]
MKPDNERPIVLQPPGYRERTWFYPWAGLFLGLGLGFLVGHPLSMVVHNIHTHIYEGAPLDITGALAHSFHIHMWPMIALFSLFGGVVWMVIGFIFQRLRDQRLRLDGLHQEFELQVAALRHHYKNLAIGIHGFSTRIKRKLDNLDEQFRQCARENCPTYKGFHQEFQALGQNAGILEDAAQRLSHVLRQELLFLKALTSDSMTCEPLDFYPVLIHAVNDLIGLRFRDKKVTVELNGRPLEDCRDTLVFPFEPYTMEVILQNIIGNAMNYGEVIHIGVKDGGNRVRVEVQDNGPGMEVEKLRQSLLLPADRRQAESSHLGLKVSLHLLEKCGGRLSAWSKPGAGALFIIEVPKQPLVAY